MTAAKKGCYWTTINSFGLNLWLNYFFLVVAGDIFINNEAYVQPKYTYVLCKKN
jgi:hypothetical protein